MPTTNQQTVGKCPECGGEVATFPCEIRVGNITITTVQGCLDCDWEGNLDADAEKEA